LPARTIRSPQENALAILLFHGPEKAAGFIEIGVVRPAVEGVKALLAAFTAAASVSDAVGAGAMPGHADEERSVVAVVGGPPVLRRGEDFGDVLLDRLEVERSEGFRVIEVLAERIGFGGVLTERRKIKLFGPPELGGLGRLRGSA
jgi:hypothetical protein